MASCRAASSSCGLTISGSCPSLPFPSLESSVWKKNSVAACVPSNGSKRRASVCRPVSAIHIVRGSLAPVKAPQTNPLMPGIEDLDTTNMLLRQRIIFLSAQVDDANADFVVSQLLLLDANDPTKKIQFFINSPGGSVIAGMGVYDVMKLCKADVSTVCFGLAASMGAFILAGGTKGKRFSMPNSRIMIHEPSTGYASEHQNLRVQTREILFHKIKLDKLLARFTGKTQEQIAKDTRVDNYMNPWEAREYGIIDAVIDENKPGLIAPTPVPALPRSNSLSSYYAFANRKEKRPALSEDSFLDKIGTKEEVGVLSDRQEIEAASAI
eukprot:TRINITY_DN33201_c0_g1_i1.p1 TRINITY_DN33201_c0_g1~~TRINITY_DN33201_c0_g1_i1.p1  ORF type:complete len:325 (-),score=60.76 TRINITY_DN33201_c0_g1_i1:429-1403(-)